MTTSALANATTKPTANTGMSAALRASRLLARSSSGGREHDRHGQEEGELGGGGAGEAEQVSAQDRGAGTGHAGKERQDLRQPDAERQPRRQTVHCGHALHRLGALDEENRQAAEHERACHGRDGEQVGLDPTMGQEPDHGGREEPERQVQHEAAALVGPTEIPDHAEETGPVEPDDGEDGAQLDEDLERLGALASEAEEVAGHDQVPGGGDRNEFGDAFDQSEEGRLEEQHRVH